jgi:hypothetical protein
MEVLADILACVFAETQDSTKANILSASKSSFQNNPEVSE